MKVKKNVKARLIPIHPNHYAIVDEDDYEKIMEKAPWHFDGRNARHDWREGKERKHIYMHHLILPPKKGKIVRHLNRYNLDNRKSNLEYYTEKDGFQYKRIPISDSRQKRKFSSNYKGVYRAHFNWKKNKFMWLAYINVKGKPKYLGTHDTQELAAKAYDKESRRLFGEKAYVNFPRERAST